MGGGRQDDVRALLDRFQERVHSLAVPRAAETWPARRARRVTWAFFLCLVIGRNPAAEGHRVRALSRLLFWHVWRRAVGRPVQVVIAPGARLSFPPWSTLAGIVLATGHHEVAEQLFVNSYVRAGDTVVDAGANLGIYSVACAVLGARVAAVEPSTQAAGALRHNIELNGLGHMVRVFPVALDARDGSGVLTTHLDVGNRLEAPGSSAGQETVRVQALDSLVAEAASWFGEQRISLIKIDCEGHDEEVLRGAAGTITRHRPVVIVESWEGGSSIRELLGEHGYRVYRFDHRRVELIEYPSSWSGQANFIAISDDRLALVENRVADRRPPRPRLPAICWGDFAVPVRG